ncbi:dienelactone hydrolase family protein [Lyngbya confervoides]|uniref:Dienelactone hydrolase family protein n=1 Tax=Lyngbya confervoides BDU141951 TaxID=1574623 RepID=A0ABD4T6M2_9CYAN|nr:dienelactone hydrolase family protein [Lyngbya confervoides]MCM1983907.1 dienelactone hydrolase family protein [Lyngbya confervoides BDU141951]
MMVAGDRPWRNAQGIQLWRILLLGLWGLSLTACARPEASVEAGESFTDRMSEIHGTDKPEATEMARQSPAQPVTSQRVKYATVNGQPVEGFFAQPVQADRPLPGIIAIHEWWGLNDNIKAVTERLAGEGYSVLAVDLYDGQVAQDPDQARQLMQRVMGQPQPAQENLRQAYDYLVKDKQSPQVGSIGWCFGGAWSLQTGLLLPDQLDALVIYYGRLETDPQILKPLTMPIAGFFGGQDAGIPVAEVNAFEQTLNTLDKPAEIYLYDAADHAFANPSGKNYNPAAANDAWEKTLAFFAKHLKTSP